MERVWGARRLETHFGKQLPGGLRIGESWELVDREDAQSVVEDGPHAGVTLHELWRDHREAVFGPVADAPRFPLLLKILDCAEVLSVQVHPPSHAAHSLGGEPKTEMWYVAHAEPGSAIFAGLKKGATREAFEQAMHGAGVEGCLHQVPTRAGDAMFIPSGRVHAIGGGNLIVEVQQNSDTTFRVYDWGRPRELHIAESMASIDFDDFEPSLAERQGEQVVHCELFDVAHWSVDAPRAVDGLTFVIGIVLTGAVECAGSMFSKGDTFLLPATMSQRVLSTTEPGTTLLRIK